MAHYPGTMSTHLQLKTHQTPERLQHTVDDSRHYKTADTRRGKGRWGPLTMAHYPGVGYPTPVADLQDRTADTR